MTKQDVLEALQEQSTRIELIAENNPGNWQQIDRYQNAVAAIKLVEGMAWIAGEIPVAKAQLNARVSDLTRRQLDELGERWGTSQTETLTVIIDRMYREETKTMNATAARKLAIEAVALAGIDSEGEPVADTTVVGKDANGYWVTDNGEEVNGLTKEQAIEIIVENLTADEE